MQSSGKLRLILDLSHLNKFIIKKSVKYADLRTVLPMFPPGMFVFSFDLKSTYHHIDTCEEHRKFLSFKWPSSDGIMKFYELKVLPKSSRVGVVYSDASDSGFGGYFVQCGLDLVSGVWSHEEMGTRSTFREILAVKFVLLSLVNQLAGLTVKWFTDNQNVPRILSSGSSKGHLQSEALSIFNICCNHGISFEMEWIPRSQNDQADFLSRIYDATIEAFLRFRYTGWT